MFCAIHIFCLFSDWNSSWQLGFEKFRCKFSVRYISFIGLCWSYGYSRYVHLPIEKAKSVEKNKRKNIFIPVDREMRKTELKLPEFLKTNLRGKVMTQIKLRPLSRHYELVTYKVRETYCISLNILLKKIYFFITKCM